MGTGREMNGKRKAAACKPKKLFLELVPSPPTMWGAGRQKQSEISPHACCTHREIPTENARHTDDHVFLRGSMGLFFSQGVCFRPTGVPMGIPLYFELPIFINDNLFPCDEMGRNLLRLGVNQIPVKGRVVEAQLFHERLRHIGLVARIRISV